MGSAFRLVNAEIKAAAIDAIGLLASLLDTKAIRIKGIPGVNDFGVKTWQSPYLLGSRPKR